jgi:hypothetical protein
MGYMPDIDEKQVEPKKRRFTPKDSERARDVVFDLLASRKQSPWRQKNETIWREVDRQIEMQPPKRVSLSGNTDEDWHNTFQLGLLADAQEILASDRLRLAMPRDRDWFIPSSELPADVVSGGVPPELQRATDHVVLALMKQQQADFGLRRQVKLSLKEALAHGSCPVEIRMNTANQYYDGIRLARIESPYWKVHSMWNAYLDPSPSVETNNLFYTGSTIFIDSIKRANLKRMRKWKNLDKVPMQRRGTGQFKGGDQGKDDLDVVIYFGDMNFDREDGGMYLPNRKWIFVENQLVYSEINDTPSAPVFFVGDERDDPRDPYYKSQLIKRSPTAGIATQLANDYLDGVDLRTRPPIVYEKNDSLFAQNGGPRIAPGTSTATSGMANFKEIVVGDPNYARAGMADAIAEVEKGTGADATRAGVSTSVDQTATEVVKKDQRSSARTNDFVGSFEGQALRPYLYLHHALNLKRLTVDYPVINNAIGSPDILRINRKDLPKMVHFKVTGSDSMLSEEARTQQFYASVSVASQNPAIGQRTNWDEVTKEVWDQPNLQSPERFLAQNQENGEMAQMKQAIEQIHAQAQEAIQAANEQIAEMQTQLAKSNQEIQVVKLQSEGFKAQAKSKDLDINALQEQERIRKAQDQAEDELRTLQEKIQGEAKRLEQLKTQIEIQAAKNQEQPPPAPTTEDDGRTELIKRVLGKIEKLSPGTGSELLN